MECSLSDRGRNESGIMGGCCSEFSCELMAAVKAAGTWLHPDFLLETDRKLELERVKRAIESVCVCVSKRK